MDFTKFASTEYIYGNAKIMVESFGNATTDEILFHAASNIFIERLKLEQSGKILCGIFWVLKRLKLEIKKCWEEAIKDISSI